MKQIKFSRMYPKLLNMGKEATLLEVIPVELADLHLSFLAYDTDNGAYELPSRGTFMLLIFQGKAGLFTTLRRWFPTKADWYKDSVGESFQISIASDID